MIHELRTNNKLEPVYVNKRDAFVLGIFRIAWLIDNVDKDIERKDNPVLLENFINKMKQPPNLIHLGGKIKIFSSHLSVLYSSVESKSREIAKPKNPSITIPESNDKLIETQLNTMRKIMRETQKTQNEIQKALSKIEELTYDIHLIKESMDLYEKDDENFSDDSN